MSSSHVDSVGKGFVFAAAEWRLKERPHPSPDGVLHVIDSFCYYYFNWEPIFVYGNFPVQSGTQLINQISMRSIYKYTRQLNLQQQQLARSGTTSILWLITLLLVLGDHKLRLRRAAASCSTVSPSTQIHRGHLLRADTIEVAIGCIDSISTGATPCCVGIERESRGRRGIDRADRVARRGDRGEAAVAG